MDPDLCGVGTSQIHRAICSEPYHSTKVIFFASTTTLPANLNRTTSTGERGTGGEGTRTGLLHQHRFGCQALARREVASDKFANLNGSSLQAQLRPSPPAPLPRVRGRGEQDASRVALGTRF